MKIAKAKALDQVDGLLRRRWRVNERHGACRCESSPGLLPTNWIQSLFLSWRKHGATVICSCIGRYHTTPYSWSAGKESAGQSKMLQTLKWRCKKGFPHAFCQGMRMMQSGYTVKRYSEVPKAITLTLNRIFQLRFCRSLTCYRICMHLLHTPATKDGKNRLAWQHRWHRWYEMLKSETWSCRSLNGRCVRYGLAEHETISIHSLENVWTCHWNQRILFTYIIYIIYIWISFRENHGKCAGKPWSGPAKWLLFPDFPMQWTRVGLQARLWPELSGSLRGPWRGVLAKHHLGIYRWGKNMGISMGVSQNGWFIMENPYLKWMI